MDQYLFQIKPGSSLVGMSESKATKKLKSLGLKVNAEVKEKESDEIEEGSVIKITTICMN